MEPSRPDAPGRRAEHLALVLALATLACGPPGGGAAPDPDPAGDSPAEGTAESPAEGTAARPAPGVAATSRSGSGVTYARDVAPILHRRCAVCHRAGESAPFPLLTYEDARKRARQIALVTESGFMPPWLPAPNPDPFRGARALEPEEIAILAAWAAAGAPEGDPADLPPPPEFPDGWALGEPDLVVEMPDEYVLAADGTDVFRNFVLPVPLERGRWIRAVDLQPGNKRVVHHAVLNVDETLSSRRLDRADDRPGFDGMYAFSEAKSPDGFFVGWTPGKAPWPGDPELAWRLPAGADLVLQLHLQPSGRPEPIRARVGLYFADGPPARPPSLLRLGSVLLDIPAGEDDYAFEDRYRLPVDVELLAVYPHAHYLGKEMKARALFPNGEERQLLHVPAWDFDWQDDYRYQSPVRLPAGTTIAIRYGYDNSAANPLNPNHPPVRVRYGPRSEDEMGDLWLQVRAESEEDRRELERDWWQKDAAAQIEGHRFTLSHDPDDAVAHAALGHYAVLAGRPDRAAQHLERAVAIRPDYALAHTNLGWCLEQAGRADEAREHYLAAIRADELAADAHSNLGFLLFRQGRPEEAERHLRRALAIDPEHAAALNNLGHVLAAAGAVREALPLFRRATELEPENGEAHHNLGNALFALGRARAAEEAYRNATRLAPEHPVVHHNLAVALIELGRGGEAREHLRRALALDPDYEPARRALERVERSAGSD